jgi:hypothetical protein
VQVGKDDAAALVGRHAGGKLGGRIHRHVFDRRSLGPPELTRAHPPLSSANANAKEAVLMFIAMAPRARDERRSSDLLLLCPVTARTAHVQMNKINVKVFGAIYGDPIAHGYKY